MANAEGRGQWGSRLGFILAAAGSAVGLGNIWKFPYIAGDNGGGIFVLIYLVCIALIGLPVMLGELVVGRRAQGSPVPAYRALSGDKLAWSLVGWLGVLTGFMILSYYSVVAGWAIEYIKLALSGAFSGDAEAMGAQFGALAGDAGRSSLWHGVFMLLTAGIVIGGIHKGIEAASRVLMPILFVILIALVIDGFTQKGFAPAASFLFSPNADKLTAGGVLEALGHSFFTLSLGMGGLITYGSYLPRNSDLVASSLAISILDTVVALMACLVLFPVLFSYGMAPEQGPGLVFISMPIALGQMPGGYVLGIVFFVLLLFAALSSAISLLEVCVATVIDQLRWSRRKATLVVGVAVLLLGLPSAESGVAKQDRVFGFWEDWFGMDFLATFDYVTSNWLLPIGGLLLSIFIGWVIKPEDSRDELASGSRWGAVHGPWLFLMRYVVPVAILAIVAVKIGLVPEAWVD